MADPTAARAEAEGAGARAWWTLRFSERPGMSPLRLSLALGGVLGAIYLGSEALLGRFPVIARQAHALSDFRLGCALIALTAYLPGALAHAARSALRTRAELAPALREGMVPLPPPALRTGRLRRVGWLGVGVFLLIPLATNYDTLSWSVDQLPSEAVWHRLLLAPLGWFVFRFSAFVWIESQQLSRIGRDEVRVDLLDLGPLAPFARAGLRHALLGGGVFSFLLFALLDQDVAPGLPFVLGVGSGLNAAGAIAALIAPMWGAHQAIAAAKRGERERCARELRALRREGGSPGAMADRIAWRGLVDAAPEWPIDAPSLRRFVLYLALPLGSWLGGALVDVALDRLFD